MKILTADDSKTIRNIIKGAVDILGHECLEASNGKETLELLEKQYQDVGLILLDLHMPEMDGFEALERIMADERFKTIPVIMVTTESEKSNISKAIRAGAKHYITKPFVAEDLSTRITECLGLGLDADLEL